VSFDEETVVAAARHHDIDVTGVSEFSGEALRPGLVLGFGAWSPGVIITAVNRLAHVLRRAHPPLAASSPLREVVPSARDLLP
jgi:hypothetical protein